MPADRRIRGDDDALRARVHASDAELVDAKHARADARTGPRAADAEAKLVSSVEAEKVNHQSLVRRVDEAEKNLADALARCADMSERRDAAESRAASAGAAADSAALYAAAESHAAMLDAERRAEDVKREMEDVKRGAEAEADALGARLEAALTELADARARGRSHRFREAADGGDPESSAQRRRRRRIGRLPLLPRGGRHRPRPADPGPARSSPARARRTPRGARASPRQGGAARG